MEIKNLKVNEENALELSLKEILISENLRTDVSEENLRDLYLRQLLIGGIQGPLTNIPNVDKEWLKYYTNEQILAEMPKETLYQYMIRKNLNHLDDTLAIIYFGKKITFKQFDKLIEDCAKSLKAKGIQSNDSVTICMPNTPEAIVMVYALNRIGAIAHMVHPLSAENEIKNYVLNIDSKMILTIDSSYNKIKNIVNETNLKDVIVVSPSDSMPNPLKTIYNLTKKEKIEYKDKTISWKKFMKLGVNENEIVDYPNEKNKVSVILQTGGTTGTSKGVELTNDNFNTMVEQLMLNESNFERGDKMLTVMPVFHGFGLCSSIHLPLSLGVTLLLIPKIDIKSIDKLMNKYKPNHILGVPTLFKGIMNTINQKIESGKLKDFDLSYLKYAVSGGDANKEGFEKKVNAFFAKHGSNAKLAKGYGLSEAVAGATFATGEYNNPTTVGIPMIKTNIKIVKMGTDEEVQNNVDGEICIQGPTVMNGYHNNPEETQNTLINGWLHTGDIGHFENGLLYFTQRKSNMIISSGVNVYPKEIEQVIEMHPAVSSCAVIGIYHSYRNEVPKAYVVLKEGITLTDEIQHEIDKLCKMNLNKYSIPFTYEYCESLPQTLLGKISHLKLREQEDEKTKVIKK